MTPSQDQIEAIKVKFPGRVLKLITLKQDDEETHFIVTAPLRVEYRKYLDEMAAIKGDSNKILDAIAVAAVAQIRYPDRDTVLDLFDKHPRWPEHFAEHLHAMAGANAEVSAKNL
jgi:hypothetical protein